MEAKIKHLEMIQNIINRMAGNSFLLKGWSVTITAALFMLVAKNGQLGFVALVLFPALMFWGLDAYFLRQERLFRRLYDDVRKLDNAQIDFSMDTRPYEKDVALWCEVLVSSTLRAFHGGLLVAIFLTAVIVAQ